MVDYVYMNRKADDSGRVPDGVDTIMLLEKLGFKHTGPMPSTYVMYSRKRTFEDIEVSDFVTAGAYSLVGRPGTLSAKHASYMAESFATEEGVKELERSGKLKEDILSFHSERLSELEGELAKYFEIVHKE